MRTLAAAAAGAALLGVAIVAAYLSLRPPAAEPAAEGHGPAAAGAGAAAKPRETGGAATAEAPPGAEDARAPAAGRDDDPRAPEGDDRPGEAQEPIPAGSSELVFRVIGADDTPSSAVVHLVSGRARSSSPTDRDGVATFSGIRAGVYNYRLEARGIPELTSGREVTVGEGETKSLTLRVGTFDLGIAGRVMDREGSAVPGVLVTARQQLTEAGEETLLRADRNALWAETGPDGSYAIEGLAEADYVVSVEGRAGSARVFRAGVRTANLIVESAREVLVRGRVVSPAGEPIAGVLVVPTGQAARQAVSDAAGSYAVALDLVSDQELYVLLASREGYRQARVNLRASEIGSAETWDVDIAIEPLGAVARAGGVLLGPEREPVPGETVYLQSPGMNARYQARSGDDGVFDFGEVQVGSDYRLLVHPRNAFRGGWLRDRTMAPVAVPEEGLTVEVVLDLIEGCSVSGAMVDADGNPIPGYTLWLRSLAALGKAVPVSGDSGGRFRAEEVPSGEAMLETRSAPNLTVRGIELVPGAQNEVTAVLDWGEHSIEGTVLAPGGAPVAGAGVALQWSSSRGRVQSASARSTVTDASGAFSFSELGPGEHRVVVTAPGYVQAQRTLDVGREAGPVTVELREARGGTGR